MVIQINVTGHLYQTGNTQMKKQKKVFRKGNII